MSGFGSRMPTDSVQAARQALEARVAPVLQRLREATTDEQKAAIHRELSAVLEGYFDQDIQRRLAELADIEARVKRLRQQCDQRQQAKEEILQLQLKVLENEAAGLGFFGGSAPAQPAEKTMPGDMPLEMPVGMPGMGASMGAGPSQNPAALGPGQGETPRPSDPAGTAANSITSADSMRDEPSTALVQTAQAATSGAEEVAVLEAELAAAEAKFEVLKTQQSRGVVTPQEVQEIQAAVDIANARLAKGRREYQAQERLLQLDVEQALLRLRTAATDLWEANQIDRKAPGTMPASTVKQKELAVKQAELSVERATTLFELHRKADPPKEQPAKEPSSKKPPVTLSKPADE